MCTQQQKTEIWNLITDLQSVPPHFQATLDSSVETEFMEYMDDKNTTQTWTW